MVAATFAFGGGLVSLLLVGAAWLLMGPAFSWPMVAGFATACVIAVGVGTPILLIDRFRKK